MARGLSPRANTQFADAITGLGNAYVQRELGIAAREAERAKAAEEARRWAEDMALKQKRYGIEQGRYDLDQQRFGLEQEMHPQKLAELAANIAYRKAGTQKTGLESDLLTQELADAARFFEQSGYYTPPSAEQFKVVGGIQQPYLEQAAQTSPEAAAALEVLKRQQGLINPPTQQELEAQVFSQLSPEEQQYQVTSPAYAEGRTTEIVDPTTGQRRLVTTQEAIRSGSQLPAKQTPGVAPIGAKSYETNFGNILSTKENAIAQNQQLANLESVMGTPGFDSGKLENATMGLKGWLGSFGLDVEGYTPQQTFRAVSNQLALDRSGALTGPASDKDMELIRQAGPDLASSPEAVGALVRLAKKSNDFNILRGTLAEQWVAKNNNLAGFDLAFQQAFPDGDLAQDVFGVMVADPNAAQQIVGQFLGGQ